MSEIRDSLRLISKHRQGSCEEGASGEKLSMLHSWSNSILRQLLILLLFRYNKRMRVPMVSKRKRMKGKLKYRSFQGRARDREGSGTRRNYACMAKSFKECFCGLTNMKKNQTTIHISIGCLGFFACVLFLVNRSQLIYRHLK